MCGRFVLTTSPRELARIYRFADYPEMPPRYNIAPTQPIAVVRHEQGQPHFRLMRWGFTPAWVKDPREFPLLINARAETIFDKPAFRNAIRRRRCLVPADGFYEWLAEGRRKRPHFIAPRDGQALAFAGLWETWAGPNGEEVDTVAIITTAANETLRFLHDRMPVIVRPADFSAWMDERCEDREIIARLLLPAAEELLAAHEVGTGVNRAANDSAELIVPLAAQGSLL